MIHPGKPAWQILQERKVFYQVYAGDGTQAEGFKRLLRRNNVLVVHARDLLAVDDIYNNGCNSPMMRCQSQRDVKGPVYDSSPPNVRANVLW